MDGILWLVTTDHLENGLWFKDDGDFMAGMNYVALLASSLSTQIMAFVLMSNHVHFVIGGNKSESLEFIHRFKKLYSQYYQHKYSTKALLRYNQVDLKELSVSDESFERAVAYVQMNPVAANICLSPSGYPWGTGNCFFSKSSFKSTPFKDLKVGYRRMLIHSKRPLPPNYIADESGFIIPSSYVKAEFVESVFRTPARMNYFLQSSSKARKVRKLPSFSDKLIVLAISELITSLFGKKDLKELEERQLTDIIKQVRRRFSADPNQISRATGISYPTIAKMLDSM